MATAVELPVQLLNDTLGALEIGVLVSYLLLGIVTSQMYVYYNRFPEDAVWLRATVAFVWLVETTQAALVGYGLYFLSVLDYGDRLGALSRTSPVLNGAFILTGLITVLVELFFIHRIWLLSKQFLIPIVLVILVIVYIMGILSFSVAGFKLSTWAEAEAQWGWDIEATAIVSVVLDMGITVALVSIFWKSRARGVQKTANMVDKLIAWAIETGVLTSLCSVLILAMYEVKPSSFIWLAVFVVKSRLYSNSLLASLNSRSTLRDMHKSVVPSSVPRFSETRHAEVNVEMFRVEPMRDFHSSKHDFQSSKHDFQSSKNEEEFKRSRTVSPMA
ncbi:hypothetical protein HMN09_01008900 [Mycena chlorophos]|uniref:DUF6534 domain-containing protein n=1 Tax=Mycena chlorophos TaxID=658473 RepID=A0A8H6SFT5_MYCCL|nr:hypothetical protein HMN09_01008900 [Mycena chlorophos]